MLSEDSKTKPRLNTAVAAMAQGENIFDLSVLIDPPIFVRGIMPRSGTNFLSDVLSLHGDVQQNPNSIWEFPHFEASPLLCEYTNRVAASPKATMFDPNLFLRYLGNAWLGYLQSFMEDDKRILLKYPSISHLDTFFKFFPTALLLIIVRDGRDLITSALKAGFVAPPPFSIWKRHSWRRLIQPSDFKLLCRGYAKAARAIIEFEQPLSELKHRAQILRIQYESLFLNTVSEVDKLLKWAKLDSEHYEWETLKTLRVRGSSFFRGPNGQLDFGRGRPRTKEFMPIGRWASWSVRQRRIFDHEAGEAMYSLGYKYTWDKTD